MYQRFKPPKNNVRQRLFFGSAAILSSTAALLTYRNYSTHLVPVPFSKDRKQYINISKKQMDDFKIFSSLDLFQTYANQILLQNHSISRFARNVAMRLLKAAYQMDTEGVLERNVEWNVFIIKDDNNINACVLPDGKIIIFTGILGIAKNKDGLATILSHEIAHHIARHPWEKASLSKIYLLFRTLLAFIDPRLAYGSALFELSNSRKMESEADYIGLKLMKAAGFNLEESVYFWERMKKVEENFNRNSRMSMDFLSTHPSSDTRIKQLQQWINEIDFEEN